MATPFLYAYLETANRFRNERVGIITRSNAQKYELSQSRGTDAIIKTFDNQNLSNLMTTR